MPGRFRHAAIVGKFQARGIGAVLLEIADFLAAQGLEVSFERETAQATGVGAARALSIAELGDRCDLVVVVGGVGTMLGVAREVARQDLPLVGINQGRLGFITDVASDEWREALAPMVAGDHEEERRSMLEGEVWRDGGSASSARSLTSAAEAATSTRT
jgi:NAD+ kinase